MEIITDEELLKKKKESAKRYNAKSYEKHKKDGATICSICYGKYSYYNKSHHNTSKRHQNAIIERNGNNK
jgi:hypothetical protein